MMKNKKSILGILALAIVGIIFIIGCAKKDIIEKTQAKEIKLPAVKYEGSISVEKALSERRSVRSFKDEPLSLEYIAQLLWAAQGIDAVTGATRTAPSAGATQPLEVYLVARNVNGLTQGLYRYDPNAHTLTKISDEDITKSYNYNAPIYIIFVVVYEKTTARYGSEGIKYANIEVGHAAQNVHLQAISLGLGSFPIGAFDKENIKVLLNLKENEIPVYVVPVGKVS